MSRYSLIAVDSSAWPCSDCPVSPLLDDMFPTLLNNICMKAAFCKHSKEELVELMLENDIEPKDYKVRHFLNNRFNDALQAKEWTSK